MASTPTRSSLLSSMLSRVSRAVFSLWAVDSSLLRNITFKKLQLEWLIGVLHDNFRITFGLVKSIRTCFILKIGVVWILFGLKCLLTKFAIPNLRLICINLSKIFTTSFYPFFIVLYNRLNLCMRVVYSERVFFLYKIGLKCFYQGFFVYKCHFEHTQCFFLILNLFFFTL